MQILQAPRTDLAPRFRPLPVDPALRRRLARRGVGRAPRAGETPDQYQARVETTLMALFRDTRGAAEFEALYRYAEPSVRRWISGALRGGSRRVDRHELVQDAFVNVYRYAGTFRDEHASSFRSWAQVVCRNVARRALAGPRSASLAELPDGYQEPADEREGPLDAVASSELCLELARAWVLLLLHYAAAYEELSPRDRLALRLVEVEGESYVEAGRRLRVGMSNMKMIMFRARRRIRARMARAMGLEDAPVRAAG